MNGYFKFGFIEAMDKVRFECVICGERLANESMKPCKLRRHQSTKHPHTVGKPREFFLRKKELVISNRPQNTRDALTRAGNENRQATVASFECALLIAQSKKPHTIGETLLKPTSVKMTEILCSTHVASKLKTVPLSNNTVKDRIVRMANDVENTLVEKLKMHLFSIQLDETTTVADEAVLIAYVQYIEDAEIKQDILLSTNLSKMTRGEDVFHAIETYKQNIPYNNLVACCTASMMGKNNTVKPWPANTSLMS